MQKEAFIEKKGKRIIKTAFINFSQFCQELILLPLGNYS